MPLKAEREFPDMLVIEGVRYSGDFFRTNSMPDEDVLYSIFKDDRGIVCVHVIRNANEAEQFFERKWLANARQEADDVV